METAYFTGVVERANEGYSVFFPDVPGCVGAGDTVTKAIIDSEQALAFHIQGLVEDGEDLPHPSDDPAIDDDIQVEALCVAKVDLPGKAVRLNITMDESLVASIDRIARNRSAFLAEAARSRLRELA